MYYRIRPKENGDYVSQSYERFYLMENIKPPKVYRDLYTWFDTKEECLEAWGLTYDPLPEPEPEN